MRVKLIESMMRAAGRSRRGGRTVRREILTAIRASNNPDPYIASPRRRQSSSTKICDRGTMSAAFSTSTARNIFMGNGFFFLMFLALTFNTEQQLPQRDQRAQLVNPQVAAGKKLWETNNCIGCHTLLGEGAYFAPELGNV